jgi:hypothetical protein
MGYRVTVSGVRAGRIAPDDTMGDWERPRFGFYWWFWVPALKSNGGKFSRRECVDINFHIFCFSASVTFWPIGHKRFIFGFSENDKKPKQ